MDVQAYVRRVRKLPKLTKERELELARIIYHKSELSEQIREAVTELATANLYIVCQIALSLHRPSVNLDDMIQEGNLALFEAIWEFDPDRDCKLCTFAGHRVRGRIRAYMDKKQLDDAEVVAIAFDRHIDDTVEREELLLKALGKLTKQEQRILQLHFCDGHKLANIGALLRMSAERVRQLQHAAITKIKRYLGARR